MQVNMDKKTAAANPVDETDDDPKSIMITDERRKAVLKRGFDLLILVTASPILLPLLSLVIVASALERIMTLQFGPLVLREPRISRGRVFPLFKFSMYRESARRAYIAEHPEFERLKTYRNLQDEPNSLTVVGKLMKKYYLDELGQVLNILAGHMSIIGPRPRPDNDPINDKPPRQLLKTGIFCFNANRWKTGKQTKLPFKNDDEYLAKYNDLSPGALLRMDYHVLIDGLRAIAKGKGL